MKGFLQTLGQFREKEHKTDYVKDRAVFIGQLRYSLYIYIYILHRACIVTGAAEILSPSLTGAAENL